MTHRCMDIDEMCGWCETQAEDAAAERRGEFLSDRERDEMSDHAADQYERELDARWP